jgi:hypothetical protein
MMIPNSNGIDSGDVPPIRTSRNFVPHETDMVDLNPETQRMFRMASTQNGGSQRGGDTRTPVDQFESIMSNRVQNHHHHHHQTTISADNSFHDEDVDDIETISSTGGNNRLYAGLVLSSKAARDMSPESMERYRGSKSPLIKASQDFKRHPLFNMRMVLVLLIIVILIITIIILVTTRSSSASSSMNSGLGSSANIGSSPSTTTVDIPKTNLPPRLGQATNFLSKFQISSKSNLDDITTPQFQAALWISDLDEMVMPIPDSRLHPNYHTFIQRYVLALLYFSTGGHNWIEKSFFLGKQSVCQWFNNLTLTDDEKLAYGVSCNKAGNVNQLLMGKYRKQEFRD